jgi:transposase InsO family protein
MPWKEITMTALRREFVNLVMMGGNISELCRRFSISRKTGYKWLDRYTRGGENGLLSRSRRPDRSPRKVTSEIEAAVVAVRRDHPAWGGRKIRTYLHQQGFTTAPAASSVTGILRRNGCLSPNESSKHKAFKRFERSQANDLWQMDFKGHIACPEGRCHPLTILDDHSRYSIALHPCLDERSETVQSVLVKTFRLYGMPDQMITDNGPPWGDDGKHPYTRLTVWLIRLGILVSHSRPRHPQTMGKDERFHRTLKAELIGDFIPWTNQQAQQRFENWRLVYNHHRPHEALDMKVPASRYQISKRSFPEILPSIEYAPDDFVRKVQQKGIVHFRGKEFRIPMAFIGQPVALRPNLNCDGIFDVFYIRQLVAQIDLSKPL